MGDTLLLGDPEMVVQSVAKCWLSVYSASEILKPLIFNLQSTGQVLHLHFLGMLDFF